jgi:epoxyqueuosine reductase
MKKQDIIEIAKEEFAKNTYNSFAALGLPQEKIWDEIDVGFAAGDDPLFAFYKQDIGEFYWSPAEAFTQLYPASKISDKNLTVISIGFYIGQKTKDEQNGQSIEPCKRWLYARNSWEVIIQDFSRKYVERLADAGLRAAAIDLASNFAWQKSPKYGLASYWSQRHTAYVAGLGTFGLCDGLISRHGKAARYTSFILEGKIEADQRPYAGIHDWCLFYTKGSCKSCMEICPVNAISEKGHDKTICEDYLKKMAEKYRNDLELQPWRASSCGLCQGAVPCQNGVPMGIFD